MNNYILDKKKVDELTQYYKDQGLLIIGLNDSQGVNVTSTFFKKGLLDYLADSLTNNELKPKVINTFSLTLNKTEHINYFLENNLSVEEIKLSQIYSAVSAFKKVMTDINLPAFLGNIGIIYKFVYAPKNGDEKINISTSLKQTSKPIVIYSSGVNDLMREVGANPFGIKSDYKARNTKPNYNYTLNKTNDSKTLEKVIDSIKGNFENIFAINPNTDIYVLGAYVPKSLQNEEMNIFRNLVIDYNKRLSELCNQYGITFVDTEEIGKKYNSSENNFHISSAGHNALANYILGCIYQNLKKPKKKVENNNTYKITNGGPAEVRNSTKLDYLKSCVAAMRTEGYGRKRLIDIAYEHQREANIAQEITAKKRK